MLRVSSSLIAGLVGLGLPGLAIAQTELPGLPADVSFVAVIANPEATFLRAELMAGRIGLTPPGAKPGWIRNHPALAEWEGKVDWSRPLMVAVSQPKLGGEEVDANFVMYLPITKKAKVRALVAKISGKDKLQHRIEGGYLVLAETRNALAKKSRPRRLTAEQRAAAGSMDLAVFVDNKRVSDGFMEEFRKKFEGPKDGPNASEDRIVNALVSAAVELSAESTPRGVWSMFGFKMGEDGLYMKSRNPVNAKSTLGAWLLKAPESSKSLVQGLPDSAYMATFGTNFDAVATVALIDEFLKRAKAKLSKPDLEELAPFEAGLRTYAKSFAKHSSIVVGIRPGGPGVPEGIAVVPRVTPEQLAKIPDLKSVKGKGPASWVNDEEGDEQIRILDLPPVTLAMLGVSQDDLPGIVSAATKGHRPFEKDRRYRISRSGLPDSLSAEIFVDVGPIMAAKAGDDDLAMLGPMARVVGTMPPIAIGMSRSGTELRMTTFLPDQLLSLAGMFLAAVNARSAGGPPPQSSSPAEKR